jgi:hypothetical protein
MAFKRGDFTATNAFYWSDVDLSAYAGNDAGLTPYSILLTDAAGKTARGFLGAVGAGGAGPAGEGVGPDLFAGWDFTVGSWPTYLATVVDANTFATTGANGSIYKDVLTANNQLYVGSFSASPSSADMTIDQNWTTRFKGTNKYGVAPVATYKVRLFNTTFSFPVTVDVTTLSFKRVLDPPSTGVHIVSAYGGSVRAWTSIDAGFNPNTITSAVVSSNINIKAIAEYYRRRRSS